MDASISILWHDSQQHLIQGQNYKMHQLISPANDCIMVHSYIGHIMYILLYPPVPYICKYIYNITVQKISFQMISSFLINIWICTGK